VARVISVFSDCATFLLKNVCTVLFSTVFSCSLLTAQSSTEVPLEEEEPSPPTEEIPPQSQPPAIRVIHYNLRNYNKIPRRQNGVDVPLADKPESEKQALVTILARQRPDVLAVCEIGETDSLADLQSRLRDREIDLPHTHHISGADPDRHLAILSRWPITADESSTTLTYEIEGQLMPHSRGILDVTLSPQPDYQLRLVYAHLKSRREVPEADQVLMRRREALLVRRHLDLIFQTEPDANVLFMGDLNDTRNEMPLRVIEGQAQSPGRLRHIPLADEDGERWTYHWAEADRYERIDYALASRGLWPEVIRTTSGIIDEKNWHRASDHRGLLITITPKNLTPRPKKP
jgi:endonuclease/exonuclease/phosphatase family metal-dependent hydrolase